MKKTTLTLGPVLEMNPKTERFTNNEATTKLVTREYRAPYVVPEKVGKANGYIGRNPKCTWREGVQRMKRYLLFIAILIALVGCSAGNPKIPVGLYREHGKNNFIEVSSEKVRLHIAGVDERDNDGSGLTFSYALWPDGRLILQVARSAELMHSYPALDYHWDGGKIIAADPKSKLQWEFQE